MMTLVTVGYSVIRNSKLYSSEITDSSLGVQTKVHFLDTIAVPKNDMYIKLTSTNFSVNRT